MEVPTPLKGEKYLKRHFVDTSNMEIDVTTKKSRVSIKSEEIVDLEDNDEQSINKGKGTIVEEEHNDQSQTVSHSKRSSSHLAMLETNKEPSIMFQRFALEHAESSQFHSKEELVKDFTDERSKSTNRNNKLMQETRRTIPVENSLLEVRETNNNVLRISTTDKDQISEVRIQMDKIGLPDKINFHKQDLEILYSNLLKSYLNKINLEERVIKLEEQIKMEKLASKGWKTQVKKPKTDLVNLASKPNEKKSNKKLIEEKDKLIESLQNKLKGSTTDHPQTEDIMVIQAKNEDLKKEKLELKSKLL